MKIRKLFKKAAAILMAVFTALSVIFVPSVFAATGDVCEIYFRHTYDSEGNLIKYNSDAIIDGGTVVGTGKYKNRIFVDGDVAFCIQPSEQLNTGDIVCFEKTTGKLFVIYK